MTVFYCSDKIITLILTGPESVMNLSRQEEKHPGGYNGLLYAHAM